LFGVGGWVLGKATFFNLKLGVYEREGPVTTC
jgi:hypothetical protein